MSDSDLRRRFQEGTQPRGEIDVDAVLRRARARRRPRVVLAAAGSVVAIAAIAVPAVVFTNFGASGGGGASTVAGDEAAPQFATPDSVAGGGDAGSTDTAVPRADALNLCTAPVADIAPSTNGLTLTVDPVTAKATDRHVAATVTLTNTGTTPIFGSTASEPVVVLSDDGLVIWHTNGVHDDMARLVDLGPGESMTYQTTFEPVVCGPEDDAAAEFRADLPAAGPGTYLLYALIDVSHSDGSAVDLVSGPGVAVTLT
jgi:hypothetical protein